MPKYNVIIAVDPGLSGGITILEGKKQPKIYEIPLRSVVINKHKKKVYDLDAITSILKPYQGTDVLFVQEKVSAMPSQGTTSMFSFGFSSGATLGIASGLEFERCEVLPQKWKKYFPELNNVEIKALKEQSKKMRTEIKPLKEELKKLISMRKTIKDKAKKIENKKQSDKVKIEIGVIEADIKKNNAKIKIEAKKVSREVVSRLYPSLADRFKRVKDDGLAESLLIGLFGMAKQDELVNNS